MSPPSLLLLEAAWVPGLEPAPSVRPFIEGWAAHQGLTVCYRSFGAGEELAHWLRHFLASESLCVAYLAAHGCNGSLHTPTSEIPLAALARALAHGRRRRSIGKGIMFGACQLGRHLDTFLCETKQKFDWALGYSETIPWLGATVTDLLFLEYLFAGIAMRADDADSSLAEETDAAMWLVAEHCRLAELMGLRLVPSKGVMSRLRQSGSVSHAPAANPAPHSTGICHAETP